MNDTKVHNRIATGELFDSWDGVHLSSGIPVLVLIVYKSKVGAYLDYDRLTNLASKVGRIKHYNILSYHKIVQNDVQIGITMEFPLGPPMRDFLMNKPEKRLNENEARGLFKQMTDGVDYLHSKNIVHRTLNFQNVYVTQGGVVKLGDYLISTKASSIHDQGNSHLKSIYHFLEPEFWGENMGDADESADVWSLGVLLYVMVCGCYPYPGDNAYDIFLSIKRGRMKFREDLSDSCANLIRNMINARSKRLTLQQVKTHPWVIGNFPPSASNSSLDSIPEDFADFQKMNIQTPPVTPNGQFAPPNPFPNQAFDGSPQVAIDNFTGEFFPYEFLDPKLMMNPPQSSPSSAFDPYSVDINNNFTPSLPQASNRPDIRTHRKRSMDDVTLRSHLNQIDLQQNNSLEARPDFRRQTTDLTPPTVSLPESPRPTKKLANSLQMLQEEKRPNAKKQLSFDDASFQRTETKNGPSPLSGMIPKQPLITPMGGDSAFTPSRRQTVGSFASTKVEPEAERSPLEQYINVPMRRSYSHSGAEFYGNDRHFVAPQPPPGFPQFTEGPVIPVDEHGSPLITSISMPTLNKVDVLKRALGNHQGRMTDINTDGQKRMAQQVLVASAANTSVRSQSPINSPNYPRDNSGMANIGMGGGYNGGFLPPNPQPYYGITPPIQRYLPPHQTYVTQNMINPDLYAVSMPQQQSMVSQLQPQAIMQQQPISQPPQNQMPSTNPNPSNTYFPSPVLDNLTLDLSALEEYDVASFTDWLNQDDPHLK